MAKDHQIKDKRTFDGFDVTMANFLKDPFKINFTKLLPLDSIHNRDNLRLRGDFFPQNHNHFFDSFVTKTPRPSIDVAQSRGLGISKAYRPVLAPQSHRPATLQA